MRHASQTNHIHPLAVKNVIAILWGYWLECYDSIASSLLIACPRFYEFISITLCSHSRHFPLSDDTYFSYYMWNRGCIVHKQRYLCRCQPNTIASACETNVPYTNLYIYIYHSWELNYRTLSVRCVVVLFPRKKTDYAIGVGYRPIYTINSNETVWMRIVNTTTHSVVISAHDDTPRSARHKCEAFLCQFKLRSRKNLSYWIIWDAHWLRFLFLVIEHTEKTTKKLQLSPVRNKALFPIENHSSAPKNWKGRKDDGLTEPSV